MINISTLFKLLSYSGLLFGVSALIVGFYSLFPNDLSSNPPVIILGIVMIGLFGSFLRQLK